jgi:hypothetical protein
MQSPNPMATRVVSTDAESSPFPYPKETHDLGMATKVWLSIRPILFDLRFLLLCRTQMLASSFRSFLGHICFQATKAEWVLSCGPSLERDQTGAYQRNARTHARAEGIRVLSAKFPWVDRADLRIFLEGFDAGEQYTHSVGGPEQSSEK